MTHELINRSDHSVYSLEITNFERLLDGGLPHAVAGGREAVAMNRSAEWWLVNGVGPRPRRRVVFIPVAFRPEVLTLPTVLRCPDRSILIHCLERSGMGDVDKFIGWRRSQRVGEARGFNSDGDAIGLCALAPSRRRAFARPVVLRYDRP